MDGHAFRSLLSTRVPLIVVAAWLTCCAPAVRRPAVVVPASTPPTATGLASYYSSSFNGRTTASGIRFDTNSMVAAHPTLPFGTVVRVTNLKNGRTANVKIVDRGPAEGPRAQGVIIDLSRRAAQRLDFIRDGRVRVTLQVLDQRDRGRVR